MIDLTMEELGAEEESAGQTGAARATDHIMEVPDEEVHFAEFFTAPRVLPHILAAGMHGAVAMDLKLGHDFNLWHCRAMAFHVLMEQLPMFIMPSPPCTMFSPLQVCFRNFERMDQEIYQCRLTEAEGFLDITAALAERLQALLHRAPPPGFFLEASINHQADGAWCLSDHRL